MSRDSAEWYQCAFGPHLRFATPVSYPAAVPIFDVSQHQHVSGRFRRPMVLVLVTVCGCEAPTKTKRGDDSR